MNEKRLKAWVQQLASEARLLSEEELHTVLLEAGKKLLNQAAYEPVGDRGTVYKRRTRNAATA